jgi:hypothetical protein
LSLTAPLLPPAASKLSHGVALLLTDLSKEPAKGLLQIVVSRRSM